MNRRKITVVVDGKHDYFLNVLSVLTGAYKSEVLRGILDDAMGKYTDLYEDFESKIKQFHSE